MDCKEKAAEAVRLSPYLLNADGINTAAEAYELATEDAQKCRIWAGYSYGAMMAYTAGYIAGIRAERRKRKEKPPGAPTPSGRSKKVFQAFNHFYFTTEGSKQQ